MIWNLLLRKSSEKLSHSFPPKFKNYYSVLYVASTVRRWDAPSTHVQTFRPRREYDASRGWDRIGEQPFQLTFLTSSTLASLCHTRRLLTLQDFYYLFVFISQQLITMAALCDGLCRLFFSLLWLIMLIFIAWPVAWFCSAIWLLLQPFEGMPTHYCPHSPPQILLSTLFANPLRSCCFLRSLL